MEESAGPIRPACSVLNCLLFHKTLELAHKTGAVSSNGADGVRYLPTYLLPTYLNSKQSFLRTQPALHIKKDT